MRRSRSIMRIARNLSLAVALVWLGGACLEVRADRASTDDGDDDGDGCAFCHPRSPRTGAHAIHLEGGLFARPMGCADCHVVPADWFVAGHLDGQVQVVFSGVASAGDLAPTWNGRTCQSAYCHGASLGGGNYVEPAWEEGSAGGLTCGACHGAPPPAPHPPNAGCVDCHAPAFTPEAKLSRERHLNGHVDFKGIDG